MGPVVYPRSFPPVPVGTQRNQKRNKHETASPPAPRAAASPAAGGTSRQQPRSRILRPSRHAGPAAPAPPASTGEQPPAQQRGAADVRRFPDGREQQQRGSAPP